MTVLVTGASGFIGRRILKMIYAASGGDQVVTLDHRWKDLGEIQELLPDRVDACIHLAWTASAAPDYLYDVQANRDSFTASVTLLRALVARGCRHLVVAGSGAEYAESDRALNEDSPLRAESPYADFKIQLYESLPGFGIPFAWARLFRVVGHGEPQARLLPSVVRSLMAEKTMPLSPCDQVRDLIDVDDAARAMLLLSEERQVGVFNVCRGEAVVLRDFLLLLAEIVQADPALLGFGQRPYGPLDPLYVLGDPSRLKGTLRSWYPHFGTREIACRIVDYVSESDR